VPKAGGQAVQVTHSPGEESFPKFSPDGSEIAYSASYNGNLDVYVIPTTGGIPTRVTYASFPDRMVDWHPDGEQILFASRRETGIPRVNQFYLVRKGGGFPEKLPVPYGELASYSTDGNELAYITKITEDYPFKRYRGGLTSEVIIFNLTAGKAENITNNDANDGKPVWAGNKIYFLSDRGENMRLNIWCFNRDSKQTTQVTFLSDFDISFLSAGPQDLVFEAGGILYLMDLKTDKYDPVNVHVVSDLSVEIPKIQNVSRKIQNVTASPGGKRLVIEARGELFNVPVKEGYTLNITNSSGAFDQQPSWSPDGKLIAYWSDKSGEYELYVQEPNKTDQEKKLTNRNSGFGYKLFWSADSKKIAFIDEKNDISVLDAITGEVKTADNYSWNFGHGNRFNYIMDWSPDSKWLAYTKGQDNSNDAIFLYHVDENKVYRVTSGYYYDYNPVFSKDGKYLFYLTDREFNPVYSGLNDGTWIYPNNTQLAALSLLKESPYLLSAKNDDLGDKKEDSGDPENKEGIKRENKKEENADKKPEVEVKIEWDDLESRLTILPPKAGNLRNLLAFEGKIIYSRSPVTGDTDGKPGLMYYDLEKREEKKIIDDLEFVAPTADGKGILVRSSGKYGIIKPEPDQKIEEPIPTDDLVMQLNPKEEWRQIFHDTWRRFRDFFYDKDMQKVDWPALRERYGILVDDARTRWDVTTIQSNLLSELSAGHTYTFGGETEIVPNIQNGYLGIDWILKSNKYQIKRIIRPASWDTEVRSPLDHPGINVEPGDYILAVNGINIDPEKDPYAAFEGLSGKTISLSISKSGEYADAKILAVKCLTQGEEQILRYLEWIESNRKLVDKLSDGQLGYVYMSNTSSRGQLELVSMFYGQLHKKGFIIDERFNGGGQLADRFLELMKRPVVYNLYWRHGRHHTWPIKANTGPFGMLINGWAGSGGDALPWAFKELEAGPIVGENTLGILVGPATGHTLIDGGGITVPGARLYDNDGHWFWEGEGVKPDFPVWDDPNLLVQGRDPQIEKVVEEVLKLLKDNPPQATPPPLMEDRTAGGLGK
ncbi:MAG: PD40 domain-containing protein, partial [Cyclobacteriaceae bacterium]|nr:PD40 domain-containing protein [Cyclobacteriaceae bacterium]